MSLSAKIITVILTLAVSVFSLAHSIAVSDEIILKWFPKNDQLDYDPKTKRLTITPAIGKNNRHFNLNYFHHYMTYRLCYSVMNERKNWDAYPFVAAIVKHPRDGRAYIFRGSVDTCFDMANTTIKSWQKEFLFPRSRVYQLPTR